MNRTILVFGTFDGLHAGHRYFLAQARAEGTKLVVLVATDATVQRLKRKIPRYKLSERIAAIVDENLADEVLPGDEILNSWKTLKEVRPDVICLGYDQGKLKTALAERREQFDFPFELISIKAYEPEIYHSSILAPSE